MIHIQDEGAEGELHTICDSNATRWMVNAVDFDALTMRIGLPCMTARARWVPLPPELRAAHGAGHWLLLVERVAGGPLHEVWVGAGELASWLTKEV